MKFGLLNFSGKSILIIGDGRQAKRKEKEFLAEGAKVRRITAGRSEAEPLDNEVSSSNPASGKAQNLLSGFLCLPAFDSAFLVYACTGDRSLNHMLVLAANSRGILSASVHHDPDACFHACAESSFGPVKAAVSTGGSFPAFGRQLLTEWETSFQQYHRERLEAAGRLRPAILQLPLKAPQKKELLSHMAAAPAEELYFYEKVLQAKLAFLCIFHGNSQKGTYRTVQNFLSKTASPELPIWFVFLRPTVHSEPLNSDVEEHCQRICSLEQMTRMLLLLQPEHIYYQPMLLENGYFREQIFRTLAPFQNTAAPVTVLPSLFREGAAPRILAAFREYRHVLFILHPSKKKQFYQILSQAAEEAELDAQEPTCFYFYEAGGELPEIPTGSSVTLVSGFMLTGSHINYELFSPKGIASRLEDRGFQVVRGQNCLLELPVLEELFRERLTSFGRQ